MHRLLAVDDQEEIRKLVTRLFRDTYDVRTAGDGKSALKAFEADPPDCVLLDIDMPGMSGVEVLGRMVGDAPDIPVVMLSGVQDVEVAISTLRLGAYDFLTKPPHPDALRQTIARAIERTALLGEVRRLRGEIHRVHGIDNIVGRHPKMLEIFNSIGRMSSRKATVLIQGESGTGKELVARALHYHGGRATGPFVTVNCAAVPDTQCEAEFVGHARGAFTDAKAARAGYFEQATGGTLFLDEIGELNQTNQAKLLRVLQEHEVTRLGSTKPVALDVRLICATNQDLELLVEQGAFRADLFYRINVIPLAVPSLRERRTDIPLLVGHFISRIAASEDEPPITISPEALQKLSAHAWPGNVRELENVIERVAALASGDRVDVEALPAFVTGGGEATGSLYETVIAGETTLPQAVNALEQQVLREALRRCDGNKSAAAAMVGISRRMLRYKLEHPQDDPDPDL
ncbi:MAG: sigma-54 dependent transcriptional regulator [bacterium]